MTKPVLNFDAVKTMSSNLLAELVKLQLSLEAMAGSWKLCCLPAEVHPIFSRYRSAWAGGC